jgi:hypothetical protein
MSFNSVKLFDTSVFLEDLTFIFEISQPLVKTFAEKKLNFRKKIDEPELNSS